MSKHSVGDLQVWWIPQVPMKPFEVDVSSVEEGAKIMGVLAKYDLFQYKNNIKPDYANAGGLRRWCEDDGDGKPGWEDWYDEETGEDDPRIFLEAKRGEI
jgi:hypothetical protein